MINYDSSLGIESMASESDWTYGSSSGSSTSSASPHNGSRTRTRTRARPRVEVMTEIDNTLMETDRSSADDFRDADRVVTSQLTIHDVTDVDSGNYTCAPSNAEPASTMVYVSEGKFTISRIFKLCFQLFELWCTSEFVVWFLFFTANLFIRS